MNIFRAANGRPWSEQPLSRPVYGRWGSDAAEDVVVCRLSDSDFEIQCHGGDAAVRRILRDLAELGFATVDADVQAALQLELIEQELQTALMHALTWRAVNYLVEQASGPLRAAFQRLSEFSQTIEDRATARTVVELLIEWSSFGLHLSRPWSIVLTGRPNVGKSNLINALLGYRRAIVADQPGTTRDVVASVTAFDGWPVELADTAGLRTPRAALEADGIELARSKLATADLRLLLLDVGEPPHTDDEALLTEWPDALVVAHKSDLPDQWGDRLPVGALRVSSRTGAGLEELMGAIVRRIVPREPLPGMPLPVSPRQVRCLREMLSALDSQDDWQFHLAARHLLEGEPRASATGGTGGIRPADLLLQ